MTTGEGFDLGSFLLSLPEERRAALRMLIHGGSGHRPMPSDAGATDAEAIFRAAVAQPKPQTALAEGNMEPETSAHFVRLSKVQPAALHWRSPGRIAAGKITILDGDPGLGKSTLLCELAARISRGQPLPGGEREEPRGVILLSAEDDLHDTIRPRIDAARGDPARVMSLVSVPDGSAQGKPFVVPGDGWVLEEMARRLDAALIIIDPLMAYLHGGISANSDQDVRRALAELKQVGERTGAAIVAVRHLNKSVGSNPLYRGGGSIGIIGAARCGLLLAADPDDPERRILAATKGNLGKLPPSLAFRLVEDPESGVARVAWEGETRWTAAQLLRASEDAGGEDHSALGAARSWLRDTLADGPRPAKEIEREASEHGLRASAVVRAKKAEGVISRKVGDGWLWQLPVADDRDQGEQEGQDDQGEQEGQDDQGEQPPGHAHLASLASLERQSPLTSCTPTSVES